MRRILFVLLSILTLPTGLGVSPLWCSVSAECVSYDDYVQPLDVFSPSAYMRDFDYQAPYLYIIQDDNLLLIVDVSDSANFEEVGSVVLTEEPRHIDVVGTTAYITPVWSHIVQMVDVSEPSAPALLSTVELPADPSAIVVAGDYAYVTAFDFGEDDHGLYVLDVSDPASPFLLGYFPVCTYPKGIILSEDQQSAYLLNYDGLLVLDISAPDEPVVTGQVGIYGAGEYLDVSDPYVFVVAEAEEGRPEGNGLYIVNVSDPQDPWIEGEYTPEGAPSYGIALWEHYAIVGGWGNGFSFIDISDPSELSISGWVGFQEGPGDFVVAGDILFARSYALCSYELREPFTADPIAFVAETNGSSWLTSYGDYAYTVRRRGKDFCVIDMSDPLNPELVGIEPVSMSFPGDLVIKNHSNQHLYAYVSEGYQHDGFHVLDVTDPADPEHLAYFSLTDSPRDLEIEGDILYMMEGDLLSYDISIPTEPVLLGSLDFGFSASIVRARGTTLFVGRRVYNHPAIFVVDAGDPENMTIISEFTTTQMPYEIEIVGSLLYVANGWGGLQIVDAHDPENLVELSHLPAANMAKAIIVEGEYAYLADTNEGAGLQVIHISDPTNPALAGYFPCPFPCALELINDHILVGSYNDDLLVAPIQCDTSPVAPLPEICPSSLSVSTELGRATIQLSLDRPELLTLTIHDAQGRLIERLYDGTLPAGAHQFIWEGRTRQGIPAAAGVYYARHRTETSAESAPVLLVR